MVLVLGMGLIKIVQIEQEMCVHGVFLQGLL